MNSEEWERMTPGAKREFDRAMRNVHETFWKETKKVGKVMVYGTGGEPIQDGLEKLFTNPEGYGLKPVENVFNEGKIRKAMEALDEIDSVRPYDMTEEDYYQYLIDMEHLHCGPHSPDSREGKWMKLFEEQREFREVVNATSHYFGKVELWQETFGKI